MSERALFSRFIGPLALFVVTAASAIASIEVARQGALVAAFWPANAIALVVLLRLRSHLDSRALAWVAIATALFAANYVCGNGVLKSAWFTAGNIAEIGVAYVILRARPGRLAMERGRFASLLPSMAAAALAAPAVGALVVTSGLSSSLPVSDETLWQQWWLPDMLGMLIVLPLGLFVAKEDLAKLREPHSARAILIGVAVLAALIVCILVTKLLAPMLLVAPLVMVAAVRFRAVGVALTIGVAAWCIIPLAGADKIMFNAAVPEPIDRIAMVQAFLALSSLLAMGVGALLDERDALERALDARRRVAAEAAQTRLRLLMNVAHEIRTPLNVIQGCGEMAVAAGPLNARQADLLNAATAAARQLQTLATDLLEVARLEHSVVTVQPETVAPLALVEAAIADVRASLGWGGSVALSVTCASMWADPQRFRQVATNLISNAVKFGGAYGPVRVSVKEITDGVLLSVSDRGPGFPPGREHEVFEPFATSSGKVTTASAGVGLSLVKQLVEAHGGTVRCISAPFIETRLDAAFPAQNTPRATAQLANEAEIRSVDPDSVF